jgi:hypothetical protein
MFRTLEIEGKTLGGGRGMYNPGTSPLIVHIHLETGAIVRNPSWEAGFISTLVRAGETKYLIKLGSPSVRAWSFPCTGFAGTGGREINVRHCRRAHAGSAAQVRFKLIMSDLSGPTAATSKLNVLLSIQLAFRDRVAHFHFASR